MKTFTREEAVADLQRVAKEIDSLSVSQMAYARFGRMSVSVIKSLFGSWNGAVLAAGLTAIQQGVPPSHLSKKTDEEELLAEIRRVAELLGKRPTNHEMTAHGRFNASTYNRRFGTYRRARDLALGLETLPERDERTAEPSVGWERGLTGSPTAPESQQLGTEGEESSGRTGRRRILFGELLDFRGLRFAPVNEAGVVYLFGMVSRELGYLIESVRTEYPDCEGKRSIDQKGTRWEHVRIEFEYRSSSFRAHGHDPDGCDVVVCWIHDWADCPVEVVELRSQIKLLKP